MTRVWIEVRQPTAIARKRIGEALRLTGSHFASRADWREGAGVMIGTMTVDVDDPAAAIAVVPPCMRADACVHASGPDGRRVEFHAPWAPFHRMAA